VLVELDARLPAACPPTSLATGTDHSRPHTVAHPRKRRHAVLELLARATGRPIAIFPPGHRQRQCGASTSFGRRSFLFRSSSTPNSSTTAAADSPPHSSPAHALGCRRVDAGERTISTPTPQIAREWTLFKTNNTRNIPATQTVPQTFPSTATRHHHSHSHSPCTDVTP
jgi:hypothetical protein